MDEVEKMRPAVRQIIPFLLLSCFLVHCGGGKVREILQSIPDEVLSWKADGQDVSYDRTTLFDYMNGGAEVYLAFDFQRVSVRRFKASGEDEIVLDIYDMGSPAEAFGVFSCDREDEEAGIGQESEYGFGMLRFWQGRYFVSIITTGDYQAAEEAILELGRAVAGVLGPEGPEPDMLRLLPQKELITDRISYFHSNINLNNRFFLASENILHLEKDTDCVFAEYGWDSPETVKLLIVRYPDETRAEAAYTSFLQAYMPEAEESGLAQMEDKQWTLAVVHENVVSIVFDASDRDAALRLQAEIQFE